MIHHHMRRLRRHGQLAGARAGEPRACGRRPAAPPREGNALEVLIDGANALPQMAEAIRNARTPRARLLVEPASPTSTPAP